MLTTYHNCYVRSGILRKKTEYLVEGFKKGFHFGYSGPVDRTSLSHNLPFRVGNSTQLWNKAMKEVKLGRYAGPLKTRLKYTQSPVGLVPKGGNQTRLIFHLSYDFGPGTENKSFNYHTQADLCSVKYNDLDHAIKCCMHLTEKFTCEAIYFSKTDLASAFRTIPGRPSQFCWMLLKAKDPKSGRWFYFVDKCMAFGASISCNVFQKFSDALKYLVEKWIGRPFCCTNYLDDFLFCAESAEMAEYMVSKFLQICAEIGCPVSHEKTEIAKTKIVFIGMLLDGQNRVIGIPEDKHLKATNMLNWFLSQRKATIKQIQSLTGLLNFLHRAIIPGRTFT